MKILKIILTILLISCPAFALENLDEMESRETTRRGGNTFYSGDSGSPSYYFQPMTLRYVDVTTGNEVWRMTNTANLFAGFSEEYGHQSSWSADGKRLALAIDLGCSAWSRNESGRLEAVWYTMLSDGSKLRCAEDYTTRDWRHREYFGWSPVEPDVAYQTGSLGREDETTDDQYLYKATIADGDITLSQWIDFGDSTDRHIHKGFTGDGRKTIVPDWKMQGTITAVTILPEGSKGVDASWEYDGGDRDWDTHWGDTVADGSEASMHNYRIGGNATIGYWVFSMQDGQHTWWRMRLTGSGSDGGPTHTQDTTSPYTWFTGNASQTEMQPLGCHEWSGGSGNDPWDDDGDGNT